MAFRANLPSWVVRPPAPADHLKQWEGFWWHKNAQVNKWVRLATHDTTHRTSKQISMTLPMTLPQKNMSE